MNKNKYAQNSASRLLLLAGIFMGSLVVAAAIGSKLITLFGLTFSATVLSYPITFLITDIVADVWGKEKARKIVLYGFAVTILAYLLIYLAIILPSAPFWHEQEAFARLFGTSLRIIIGGLLAYVVSQMHDIWMFHLLKALTKGKWLWFYK